MMMVHVNKHLTLFEEEELQGDVCQCAEANL